MSDDPCSVLCSFCFIGCFEACAAFCVDYNTYRHVCTERCGTKRWRRYSEEDNNQDEDDTPPLDERRPLLNGMNGSQPRAQPNMTAGSQSN